jgi:class 3 adenylate cyclase
VTVAYTSTAPVTIARAERLPWWRRPRRLRRQLAGMLAGTAFVSLLIVGILNSFAADTLLRDGARDQLISVAEGRAHSIESGIENLLARTSATATDQSVAAAVTEFEASFAQLDSTALEPGQIAELEGFYESEVLQPLATIGVDGLVPADVSPPSEAGRYLQYHYTLPITEGVDRIEVDDAGDGSAYSAVHARFHPFLSSLTESSAIDDVLLVSLSGDVVYSAQKRIDLGTNLGVGLSSDSALSEAVLDRVPSVRTGESVMVDLSLYVPGGGRAALFSAVAVKDDTEVVGTLVLGISVDALTAITTAGGDWDGVGLGGGESYVVGRDLLLRSESRYWLDDPQRYLDETDDPETASLIERLGSPVMVETVDTAPVQAAVDGETFEGSARNYLGDKTFAYARQISAGGTNWVVVAEKPSGELRSPLFRYALRLGLIMALVLPAAALLGYIIADRLTRAIPPVVELASDIAGGARDLEPPDLGANEFGDLARRLSQLAAELGQQEAALAAEYENRRQLLLSVLPPRLVEAEGQIHGTGETTDIGTVVAVSVEVAGDPSDDGEAADFLRRFGRAVESRAEQYDVERVRSAHDRFLLLAGVDRADDGARKAVDFAVGLLGLPDSVVGSEDLSAALHIGLSTGPVATGVLERGSITFTAWGEPVRRALAIGALSSANEVLLDDSTAAALDDTSMLEPATDVIALDGQRMNLFTTSQPALRSQFIDQEEHL